MLIVLIIFILLPSIFTFAVSHISANKLQYLRYQIKQVSYVVYVFSRQYVRNEYVSNGEVHYLSSEDKSFVYSCSSFY